MDPYLIYMIIDSVANLGYTAYSSLMDRSTADNRKKIYSLVAEATAKYDVGSKRYNDLIDQAISILQTATPDNPSHTYKAYKAVKDEADKQREKNTRRSSFIDYSSNLANNTTVSGGDVERAQKALSEEAVENPLYRMKENLPGGNV